MTVKSLKHKFASAIGDGSDGTLVRPSNWNDEHDFWLGFRSVTVGSDTIAHADHFSLITYNGASAIAVSLPAPTAGPPATFPLGWYMRARNIGPGAVTFTGAGAATINGVATLVLNQDEAADLYGTGTNDFAAVKIPKPAGFTINIVTITTSQVYNRPANLLFAIVELVAGGAGGGGTYSSAATVSTAGGGGGSGGYSRRKLTAAQIGASQTITIGAFGVGGAAGDNPGANGGDTSFGSLVIAKGGLGGGAGWTTTFWHGGAGGSITGALGDIVAAGDPGGNGAWHNGGNTLFASGQGGSSFFGGGAVPAFAAGANANNGNAASNYGSGGSGAVINLAIGSLAGGNGSPGAAVITEYLSV